MTADQIKELRKLAQDATPGPWVGGNDVYQSDEVGDYRICKMVSTEDSAFIATANPAAILSLLARIEALEQDAARYLWATSVDNNAEALCSIVMCHGGDQAKINERVDSYRHADIAKQDKGKETV